MSQIGQICTRIAQLSVARGISGDRLVRPDSWPYAYAMSTIEDDPEAAEETRFWQSQPGAHDDLRAGREAARDDLHDESGIRGRYELP